MIFFLSYVNVFSQEIYKENEFTNLSRLWEEADIGIIISNNGIAIEKVFENIIGNKIFYIGAQERGNGIFYTQQNGNRTIILETYIRYDSRIIWHGENIAEIFIPTGSPFTHSYYFNFLENKLSEIYSFPMYYDVVNNYVLVWGGEDFELYDVKTDKLIRIYNYRRINGLTPFWPFMNWHVEKKNDAIIMYWEYWDKNSGEFIF
jgi:hypothetical protein